MMIKLILAILLVFEIGFSSDLNKNVQVFNEKVKEYKLKNHQIPIDENTLINLQKVVSEVKKKYSQEAEKLLENENSFLSRKKIELQEKSFLLENERLYIFMSKSVPENIWIQYAKTINDFNLLFDTKMILRGCIESCDRLEPTITFIRKVLTENGKNEKGLMVDIEIDPFLFRLYQIKHAPCFVFAEGIEITDLSLSEGLGFNLKKAPKYFISCGSYTFDYHIDKLYKLSKNPRLKQIHKTLTENRFYEVKK